MKESDGPRVHVATADMRTADRLRRVTLPARVPGTNRLGEIVPGLRRVALLRHRQGSNEARIATGTVDVASVRRANTRSGNA